MSSLMRIGTSALCFLAVSQPALADQFPGKGDEHDWLKACDICNQGVGLMQNRQFPQAFQCFQKAIDWYPYDPVYYYDLGVAHQQYSYFAATPAAKQQELQLAEPPLLKATELKSDKPDCWLHLANVENELGKYQDSLNSLEAALALPALSATDRQSTLTAIAMLKAKGAVAGSGALPAGQTPTSNITSTTQHSGWESYSSPAGAFTMQYPNGWTVSTNQTSGLIEAKDANGSELRILPFASPNKIQDPAGFFQMLLIALSPGEKWTKPERFSDNSFRSSFTNDKGSAVAGLVVINTPQGTQGKVCVATVAKGARLGSDTIAEMINSVRSTGKRPDHGIAAYVPAAANPAPTQLQAVPSTQLGQSMPIAMPPTQFAGYRLFVDPSEHAFTIQVPVGWKVEGGLVRPQAIDARPWVKAVSPDNLITVFYGDGKIPPFTMPTAQSSMLGWGVGAKYNGGLIEPYIPARKFAEKHARESLKHVITDIKVVEEANHPDIARAVNGTVGATRSECSSIKFTGMYGNIPVVGYYIAATKATMGYGSGMWWVNLIAGSISPADRANGGLSVLLQMLRTFQFDAAWKGNSVKTAGDVSRQYTAASHALSDSIVNRYWSQQAFNDSMNASYWNRQAVQDHAADNFSNYIRGVENVQDPTTGTQYQVQYGPQYHWIDPGGNVAGTNYSAPGPEWRQLMSVP